MIETILTLITARGGSKGVPRKNICPLAGKPLIAWTIEAARQSTLNSRIIVSTDDPEIADVSKEFGAEAPFLRPAEFATDSATSESVIEHTLSWLAQHDDFSPDLILLLQPTSPFRTSDDIDNAYKILQQENADALVSVTTNTRPVQWLRLINEEGFLADLGIGSRIDRRQDAELLYELNGGIYLIHTDVFLKERTLYPERTIPYVMPPERSLDIDNELDFLIADLVMRHNLHLGSAQKA
ncbi:MAG: hypothetical protein A2X80_06720 [Geobacteraceae bacterium GWB2_52_12]|nr:MAG: hypothetical protein A2X80_06720 [Geobacteraceae bacterium GWB2_52_12]